MKQCPFCAESIQDEAMKCRFCNSMLDGSRPLEPAVRTASLPTTFHSQRTWIMVMGAAGILSAFLPWITAPIVGSVSGIDGPDGWLVVGIFVVALLIGLTGNRSQSLSFGGRAGVAIFGIAGTALAAWKISSIYEMKSSGGNSNLEVALSNAISVGAGLWVMAVAGALLVGAALTSKR